MNFVLVILYALFFGFLTGYIAERRGYNSHTWFWLGILLGIIATGILLFQPARPKSEDTDQSQVPTNE